MAGIIQTANTEHVFGRIGPEPKSVAHSGGAGQPECGAAAGQPLRDQLRGHRQAAGPRAHVRHGKCPLVLPLSALFVGLPPALLLEAC